MIGFTAILLVCLNAVPSDKCNESNAVDVLSHHVDNELQCAIGWQELASQLAVSQDIGNGTYVRTLCRRPHQVQAQRTARTNTAD